jgi:DNA-directed RNA polymerase subunit H (RpoH/RPB5)
MASTHVSSTIISKLYKSRNIILEQLEEQGYNTSNYNGFSINEVNIMYNKKQLDMLLDNDAESKIYIKYHITKKINANNIYETVTDLFEMENILNKETDRIVFVIKDEPNDTMLKTQEQVWHSDGYYISIINLDRLQFNITKHKLVPKHFILNKEQEQLFFQQYNIINPKSQLPTISRFDPVAVSIGLRPGQICKINRNSQTSIENDFYRICV